MLDKGLEIANVCLRAFEGDFDMALPLCESRVRDAGALLSLQPFVLGSSLLVLCIDEAADVGGVG